ncbi:unnamed protein product [Haemonchus placei]|uniref:Serine/threonine protein phosphatase n=1 Tax=Haemonchus placei TaxID=6290 RepID=A0A0N4X2D5_HAEPC|nr:unnamed protein product [Haemonchus placei]
MVMGEADLLQADEFPKRPRAVWTRIYPGISPPSIFVAAGTNDFL